MPLPNINTNINNVSMDYFLRGVDAVKRQNAGQVQSPGSGGESGVHESQELASAGKMVAQLDILLLKAATASTKSLDAQTVKTSLQKLLDDGKLDKNSLKLLAKTADGAAKALKALDKFTGSQLAAAFDANGEIDPETKVGKAILAAIEAQQNLSDKLAELGDGLRAMSRNEAQMKADNPQFKGVDQKLLYEVDEMRFLCDRRGTEISRLAFQMREFALYQAAEGNSADPNITAILKAKVNELLPRQALAMHGTADALSTVSEQVAGKLRPVAEKIEAFRNNPSASLDSKAYHELRHDIATMKAALVDIRTNGIEVGGGRLMVADDIIGALEKEVASVADKFKTARNEVRRQVLNNYLNVASSLINISEMDENRAIVQNKDAATLLGMRDKMISDMTAIAKEVIDDLAKEDKPGAKDEKRLASKELEDKMNKAIDFSILLTKKAKNAQEDFGTEALKYNELLGRLRGASSVAVGFYKMIASIYRGDAEFFTGAEAMGVFKGTISVSSLVEARARGLADGDVDPANEDANIVGERKLGAGAAGTVFELTRTDGVKVVFKGETESRTGLANIVLGGGHSYDIGQETVNLNIAAKNAANVLGMGDLIVDYSAGVHKGVFGFYMEKAKGMTAKEFVSGKSSSSPDAGMSAADIKRLPTAERQQVKADMMRELNRMQWLDLVTGQGDRHGFNYFIHVDKQTHKVTVKGIDNDAGYSQYRTGAMKFTLDEEKFKYFYASLEDRAKELDKRNVKAEYQNLLKDPGITSISDKYITIDASKIANKAIGSALVEVMGMQTLAIPDKIDRETYNSLIALKEGPKRDEYLKSIESRLSKGSYSAAVKRLDDVIAHAEALAAKGGIIEPDGWLNVKEAPMETGKVKMTNLKGREVSIGGEVAKKANKGLCPSIFARDGLDKLFT